MGPRTRRSVELLMSLRIGYAYAHIACGLSNGYDVPITTVLDWELSGSLEDQSTRFWLTWVVEFEAPHLPTQPRRSLALAPISHISLSRLFCLPFG